MDPPSPLCLLLFPPVCRELGQDSECPAVPLPAIAVFLNELRADESLIAGEKKIKSELD